MLRTLLAGTKTQTRLIAKIENTMERASILAPCRGKGSASTFLLPEHAALAAAACCPYGQTGDRLCVRETFDPIYPQDPSYNGGRPIEYDCRATYSHGDRLGDSLGIKKTWKPPIHMPRAASRILLEITDVRVERLQDISEDDAIAEGGSGGHGAIPGYAYGATPIEHYRHIWNVINGANAWAANPWVWAVSFRSLPSAGGNSISIPQGSTALRRRESS